MRYREIVNELHRQAYSDDTSFEEIWAKISVECSDAIAAMKEARTVLYRGRNGMEPILYSSIPTEREPRDIPVKIHNIIEKWMIDNGYAARRSNSLFVVGAKIQASYYGEPYIIFPTNGFKFTWFKNTHDLYGYLKDRVYKGRGKLLWLAGPFEKKVDDIMRQTVPSTENLASALASNNEIMITGCHYYALRDDLFREKVYDAIMNGKG